jgi:hypothetical protein
MRMTQRPVQAELPQEEAVVRGDDGARRCDRRYLVRRQQHADRDGQVVRRPLLAQIGWSQVDGDAAQREDAAAILHRGAHALLGLGDGSIRQPDDAERGQPMADIHLDIDQRALQPYHRAGAHFRQHCARLPLPAPPRANGGSRPAWHYSSTGDAISERAEGALASAESA